MVSDNPNAIPSSIVEEAEHNKVFCEDDVLVDAYAAVQIGQYFSAGSGFEEQETQNYEALCNGFKRGHVKWFPLNKLLNWLSLLDSDCQKRAGQLWTTRIAQDVWGNHPSKEELTLFDAFSEISNIYQIHHRHKDVPDEKVVGEITVSIHPEDKDTILMSEIDSPWTGYYENKIWREFHFLPGAWEGVALGFSGNAGQIVVEESGPGLRRYRISY